MNLVKIESKYKQYIEKVKDIKIPDVYELSALLGDTMLGRKIYTFEEANKTQEYFNKCMKHKGKKSYIGKPSIGFYSEEIVNVLWEERCLCVNGNCNKQQLLGELIMKKTGLKDFVFDIYSEGRGVDMIMELNEIHLATLNKKELGFINSQIF